jgi:hypothetical protein
MRALERERIEALVELLIDMLDQDDGDIDFEPNDWEQDGDDEGGGWVFPAHLPGGNGKTPKVARR